MKWSKRQPYMGKKLNEEQTIQIKALNSTETRTQQKKFHNFHATISVSIDLIRSYATDISNAHSNPYDRLYDICSL